MLLLLLLLLLRLQKDLRPSRRARGGVRKV